MASAFISLGSNLGSRTTALDNALSAVSSTIGVVTKYSSIYETQSWGYQGKNFLNMVIEVETNLAPKNLLSSINKIETEMGRVKDLSAYADRIIDLDILLLGNQIISLPELTIPHPFVQDRKFVLVPLNEIAPELIHPILHKSIKELLEKCRDTGWVDFFGEINSGEV